MRWRSAGPPEWRGVYRTIADDVRAGRVGSGDFCKEKREGLPSGQGSPSDQGHCRTRGLARAGVPPE